MVDQRSGLKTLEPKVGNLLTQHFSEIELVTHLSYISLVGHLGLDFEEMPCQPSRPLGH